MQRKRPDWIGAFACADVSGRRSVHGRGARGSDWLTGGVLTREEHDAGSRSMFDPMDTDRDGSVTAAEMQSGHDKMVGG